MAYSDSNFFEKLLDTFGNFMTMEQIAKIALTSKVILSYKIDFLNSFHDLLMKGLWKRSSNGCIYPLDKGCERILYVEINKDYEVDLGKSLEKLRNLSAAHKVFAEKSEPVLCESQIISSEENDAHNLFNANEMNVSESCILQQGEVVCNADQVLDEMSESILSSNDSEIILFDNESVVEHNNGFQVSSDALEPHTSHDSMSHNHHLTDKLYEFKGESDNSFVEEIQQPDTHNMLDELPIPTFILEMAQAAKAAELVSTRGDCEHELDIPCDEHHSQSSNNDVVEPSVNYMVEDVTNPTTHNLFGEKLQPNATLQIAQTADIVYNQLASDEINEEGDGSLYYKRHVFVILDKLPHEVYKSFGKSYFECPCPQVNTNHSTNFIENVLSPLMLSDVDWFMGSSLSRILGVQAYNTRRVFESVVNRKTFLTFKELYSWGIHSSHCHWAWLEIPLGEENFLACLTPSGLGFCSRYNSCAGMIVDFFGDLHTFDSGGNVNSFCGCKLWQVGQLLLPSDSMLCYIIAPHDPINDKILAFISLPKRNTRPWSSTLEDKGDFRGEEDTHDECTRKCFISLGLCSKCHARKTYMYFVFLTYIFDPGDLNWRFAMLARHVPITRILKIWRLTFHVSEMLLFVLDDYWFTRKLQLHPNMSGHVPLEGGIHSFVGLIKLLMTTLFRVFFKLFKENLKVAIKWLSKVVMSLILDPIELKYNLSQVETVKVFYSGGKGDLSAATSVRSALYTLCVVGINSHGMLDLMFLFHLENDPFQSDVVGYVRRVHYLVYHGFVTINSKQMSKFLPNHLIVGHMKQLLAGDYLVSTYAHSPTDYIDMLLSCGIKNQNVSILIFDPGGFKSRLKMMNVPEAYQFNGCNYEDYQVYVFDPGGPFMRLLMDAMVTNPKPRMCYATSSFKHRLSMILEDKDRFKRLVLIHTHYNKEGILVISASI